MDKKINKFLNIKYPQNYIISNPSTGAIIIAVFCFGFSALYKPSDFHASRGLSYESTMALYSLIAGFCVIINVKILRNIRWFADINSWTLIKELVSVIFVLFGIAVIIYLSGFIIETAESRWNVHTILNSIKNVILVGLIPFAFFSAINYRYLFLKNIKNGEDKYASSIMAEPPPEDLVHISSQLKKEELDFYPSQFIYAESDGNYVIFYLLVNNLIKKQIIRNSIGSVEQQLSVIPYFLRTHRSFIVNLKKVKSKQGNILGYQLKLSDTEFKIPVSREKTKIFNNLFSRYYNS
jgi:DNA-binding LytR/AlgR family response regulator